MAVPVFVTFTVGLLFDPAASADSLPTREAVSDSDSDYYAHFRSAAAAEAAHGHTGSRRALAEFDGAWSRHTVHGFPSEREFWVYVPPDLPADSVSSDAGGTSNVVSNGVVLFFHGYSQRAAHVCNAPSFRSWNVSGTAQKHGFVAVCPQGLGPTRQQGWNNEICCGKHGGADDVGFVHALLQKLRDSILPSEGVAFNWGKRGPAGGGGGDASSDFRPNVLAMGYSTGGLFSYRLGCELSEEITGIAPVGATWDHAFAMPGTMTWADNCKTSVEQASALASLSGGSGSYGFPSVWQGIGDSDKFTDEATALTRWDTFSTDLLGCGGGTGNGQVTTQPRSILYWKVTCREYEPGSCAARNGTTLASKMCLYSPLNHVLAQMRTRFEYGSAEQAWLYLSYVNGGSLTTSTTTPSNSTLTPAPAGNVQLNGSGAASTTTAVPGHSEAVSPAVRPEPSANKLYRVSLATLSLFAITAT